MKIKDINTIFNDTKDGKLYTKIITKAKSQNRTRLKKDNKEYIYYEKHYILPKSIYPEYSKLSDNDWNGVLLTAREHFICHLLLVNHYRKIGDRSNWHKMSLAVSKLKCNNKYYNSRLYETVRKSFKHSEATKEHLIGHTRESQLSLKNKNLENNIGLWCSDKEEDLKNIKFEQFGEVYSENKRKYNIYCYGELIYTNLTEPDIARKLPNIKYALRKTSREQPLGHGAGRQTSWLIERGLINKYKGYFKEII